MLMSLIFNNIPKLHVHVLNVALPDLRKCKLGDGFYSN